MFLVGGSILLIVVLCAEATAHIAYVYETNTRIYIINARKIHEAHTYHAERVQGQEGGASKKEVEEYPRVII